LEIFRRLKIVNDYFQQLLELKMLLAPLSLLKKLLNFGLDCLVPEGLFNREFRKKQNSGLSIFQRLKYFAKVALVSLISFFFLLSISGVIIYRFVPPAFTPLMMLRIKENIFSGKKVHIRQHWEPISKISPNMTLAVIASEDNRFLEHFGLDIEAIKEAEQQNKHSRRPRGASTISQQTAKNVFLSPNHSYIRKGLEVYFTLLIETCWSKKRIMEVYLNVIEMGEGIYGVEAASQFYFHKSASKLSRQESALIAAVLPNPRRWRPDRPTEYILHRQSWILWNMNNIDPNFGF
jgi:monofunctional biosynthetic peptidoglycan transglycosylase